MNGEGGRSHRLGRERGEIESYRKPKNNYPTEKMECSFRHHRKVEIMKDTLLHYPFLRTGGSPARRQR